MKAAIAIVLFSTAAGAYPSMIRHGYTQCSSCHTDPSGGSLLTDYGRAQSEVLLSSRWGARDDAEASSRSKFLFGAVPASEHVILGGWWRNGYIWNVADGKLVDHRSLQMRADFAAEVRVGSFRAAGQLGYAGSGAPLAAVNRGDDGSNDMLVADIIRRNELQVWFLVEHVVDVPTVRA